MSIKKKEKHLKSSTWKSVIDSHEVVYHTQACRGISQKCHGNTSCANTLQGYVTSSLTSKNAKWFVPLSFLTVEQHFTRSMHCALHTIQWKHLLFFIVVCQKTFLEKLLWKLSGWVASCGWITSCFNRTAASLTTVMCSSSGLSRQRLSSDVGNMHVAAVHWIVNLLFFSLWHHAFVWLFIYLYPPAAETSAVLSSSTYHWLREPCSRYCSHSLLQSRGGQLLAGSAQLEQLEFPPTQSSVFFFYGSRHRSADWRDRHRCCFNQPSAALEWATPCRAPCCFWVSLSLSFTLSLILELSRLLNEWERCAAACGLISASRGDRRRSCVFSFLDG